MGKTKKELSVLDARLGWRHNELADDLAVWLQADDFVCAGVRFGSAWLANASIPDVMKVRKSYTRWDVQIYEVKTNRPDFIGELRNGKWRDYLPMSSRLYFATPADGVVDSTAEIPEGVGWIVRGEHGWKVRQSPKIREFTPSAEQMLALLMSVEKARCKLAADLAADKKVKHRHNIGANHKMWNRVYRVEQALHDQKSTFSALRAARARFKQVTGLDVNRYNWLDEMENKLNSASAGVDVGALRRVVYGLVNQAKELNSLIPGTDDQAIAEIETKTKGSADQDDVRAQNLHDLRRTHP